MVELPSRPRRPLEWKILSFSDIFMVIEPGFLIFLALIYYWRTSAGELPASAGLFLFVIFFSLLAHESGHALVARYLNLRPIRVALVFFGGNTFHPPTTHGRSFFITLGGPAGSLMLASVAYGLMHLLPSSMLTPPATMLLNNFLFINIIWLIFNLLPIFPMDGGMLMLHALAVLFPRRRTHLFVAGLSLVMCAAIGYYALKTQSFILLYFVFIFFMQNLDIVRANR